MPYEPTMSDLYKMLQDISSRLATLESSVQYLEKYALTYDYFDKKIWEVKEG